MRGRGIAAAAAVVGVAALSVAQGAQATYPGRNGKFALEITGAGNSSIVFDGISTIPQASTANCRGSDQAGGTSCSIGRISFSPDGRTLAAERNGAEAQLELVNANGKDVRFLARLTANDSQPAFLPGGKSLVFTGKAHGKSNLYTVRLDGTGLKQLTTGGGSWAAPCANGTIVFLRSSALYIVKSDGTGLRRLVARRVHTPDCSPNSQTIIYDAGRQFATVPTAGGKVTTLRAGGQNPVFSPDGTRFAYVGNAAGPGGNMVTDVWIASLTGKTLRRFEVADLVITGVGNTLDWGPKPS
ncbi:MAG: hypothetical protein M3065_19785 [Actinomycetota bacterium]|nr:hypothetical protein [Actinomycetota bacterium]